MKHRKLRVVEDDAFENDPDFEFLISPQAELWLHKPNVRLGGVAPIEAQDHLQAVDQLKHKKEAHRTRK